MPLKAYLIKLVDSVKKGKAKYTIYNSFNQHFRFHYIHQNNIQESLTEYKVLEKLRKKYSYVLKEFDGVQYDEYPSDKIWTVWLQGYDYAPELSKVCISSVLNAFGEDRVTIITLDNIENYIHIPEHIIQKWKDGKISYVHLADYIQIALLAQYGGTWFDATVLVMNTTIPDYFMNSPFFVFSNEYRNTPLNISSWFMSSYANSKLLNAVKKLLEEYWMHENGTLHYLILHMFVKIVCDQYPELWKAVPKFSNIQSHALTYEIFEPFREERINQIAQMCPIQKLSNKFAMPMTIEGTNYHKIILEGARK